MTLASQSLSHILVASNNERTIHFPVWLLIGTQTVETTALINFGATGNFIDLGLLSLANFPLKRMSQPVRAFNVNGSLNKWGTIMWKASTHMLLSKEPENIELMVVGLGHCQIILGMPWLKTWNPHIDWKSHSLSFPTSFPNDYDEHVLPQQYLLHWLGLNVDRELSSLYAQQYFSEVDVSLREYLPQEDLLDKLIQKITLSTQLAQDTKTSEVPLPKWCEDFTDVFSEKTYNILPPHHSYDHTIDLKLSFVPKIAKVYPLNPKEKEACQAFIEGHLKTGCILPSKSPQAALFFFVPKKDGSLCPCQDYQYLNSHTV